MNPEENEERKEQVKRYWAAAKKGKKKSSTNALTDFIINSFQALPYGDAFRVNTQGTFDPRKKRYIYSNSTKGFSDVQALYKGIAIYIEVKNEATKDRLSENQKKFRYRVNKAGALYFIAKNQDQFFKWFEAELSKAEPFKMPEYLL